MCGVAGCAGHDGDGRAIVERQLATVKHRGVDSTGVIDAGWATIGQNRLRIIDLATGDPPIATPDGDVGVTLNGEIYNYRGLRAELRERGHHFTTSGDTEVIAHLAEDLEPVQLARSLDGMFAFAVVDRRRRRLVLGRDRLGKKPLYYWTDGRQLVFGSEIKAVLAHPAVPRVFDHTVLSGYLTMGYVATPHTFFAGVRSLPPGCVLVHEPGAEPRLLSYWEWPRPEADDRVASMAEAVPLVRDSLKRAVERRLEADVPLGAFLSGGVDSSAVVATMTELMPGKVQTFTIGFDDVDGFDERPYARDVADRFGTDHTEFVVTPDAVDLIERLVWHHDQPFGDSSAIPTFLLCELTRQHVTVALTGDGGDELFAGYERFNAALAVDRLPLAMRPLAGAAAWTADRVPRRAFRGRARSAQRLLRAATKPLPDAYLDWVAYIDPAAAAALVRSSASEPLDAYRGVWRDCGGPTTLDRLLELNARTYLLDDLLPKADRMSMAHALEVRSPLLDVELVDLSVRLAPELKTLRSQRKRVLRHAMKGVLPESVLDRRKRGFAVPMDRWMRTDLRAYVEATLLAPDARIGGYLHTEPLANMWSEHQRDEADHGLALWTILTLEVFLRREGW